jgi:hypothetical protein
MLKMKRIQANEKNRFSTFVKSRNSDQYRDLERWQQWFTGRGIPSTIICTRSGYALYREGLVEVDIHDDEIGGADITAKSFFGKPHSAEAKANVVSSIGHFTGADISMPASTSH